MEDSTVYDLIIIGSGPAGLTASIYASCYHLKHLVIGATLGGQLQLAPDILNYPGFGNIAGKELTGKMVEQVKLRGGEVVTDSVVKIAASSASPENFAEVGKTFAAHLPNSPDLIGVEAVGVLEKLASPQNSQSPPISPAFELVTQSGNKYQAKAIILATGTERRKLNTPGEVEYTGKGVHYCATCEKFDYTGKVCAVVGGANSAVQATVELAQAAKKVYIIYRGSQLRGDPIWLEQIDKNPNIEVIYNSVVTEIVGDGEKVTGIKTKSNVSNSVTPVTTLDLDKVFIEIGGVPGTALVIPLGVKMDSGGYIEVNERLATNISGIFAAGDLVSYALSIEQISSAVGLGARAAASVFAFVKEEKAPTVWGGSRIRR